jgi:hypothetical protein
VPNRAPLTRTLTNLTKLECKLSNPIGWGPECGGTRKKGWAGTYARYSVGKISTKGSS